jgi:hypothetical protein
LRLLLGMTGLLITSSNGRTLKIQTEALPKNRTLEGVAHAARTPCRVLRAMSAYRPPGRHAADARRLTIDLGRLERGRLSAQLLEYAHPVALVVPGPARH